MDFSTRVSTDAHLRFAILNIDLSLPRSSKSEPILKCRKNLI